MNHPQQEVREGKGSFPCPGDPVDSFYVLEHDQEFVRLEKQACKEGYRISEELSQVHIPSGSIVLDAGCGSGHLSRYLKGRFPQIRIHAVDFSQDRIDRAQEAAGHLLGVEFHQADLRELPFPDRTFDRIFCRFVIHHMPQASDDRLAILREFYRCLKPGGQVIVIEPDAMFYNLYPQSNAITEMFKAFFERTPVDLCVGRKLPELLIQAGFQVSDWRVQTIGSRRDLMRQEQELMQDRLDQLEGFLDSLFSDSEMASRFRTDFLAAFSHPATTYHCNKFIVTAVRANSQ